MLLYVKVLQNIDESTGWMKSSGSPTRAWVIQLKLLMQALVAAQHSARSWLLVVTGRQPAGGFSTTLQQHGWYSCMSFSLGHCMIKAAYPYTMVSKYVAFSQAVQPMWTATGSNFGWITVQDDNQTNFSSFNMRALAADFLQCSHLLQAFTAASWVLISRMKLTGHIKSSTAQLWTRKDPGSVI
jgi:hypothetical protein